MKRIDYTSPEFARWSAIIVFLILILDILFHKSPNLNRFFEEALLKKPHPLPAKKPAQRKELAQYLGWLEGRKIFYFPEKKKPVLRKEEREEKNPLEELTFNGIIILDKKYLAIYNKRTQSQSLISEGEVYQGIKVKKIKESSVILEIDGEEKEISF
jgi:type II secretory pathway component PulC